MKTYLALAAVVLTAVSCGAPEKASVRPVPPLTPVSGQSLRSAAHLASGRKLDLFPGANWEESLSQDSAAVEGMFGASPATTSAKQKRIAKRYEVANEWALAMEDMMAKTRCNFYDTIRPTWLKLNKKRKLSAAEYGEVVNILGKPTWRYGLMLWWACNGKGMPKEAKR